MEKFTKDEIVPDVISAAPGAKMKVEWDGRALEPGAEWTPTQVQNEPHVEWAVERAALYTLILTDPDAPSRANPTSREFLHWLVVNVPGCDISKGQELVGYIGSGAPKDTGLHRYCFLVFKQPGPIQADFEKGDKFAVGPRRQFKTQTFADKHKFGAAAAGNFFLAQYDDYVPTLHAKFVK